MGQKQPLWRLEKDFSLGNWRSLDYLKCVKIW